MECGLRIGIGASPDGVKLLLLRSIGWTRRLLSISGAAGLCDGSKLRDAGRAGGLQNMQRSTGLREIRQGGALQEVLHKD